jgi:hypothetical protein
MSTKKAERINDTVLTRLESARMPAWRRDGDCAFYATAFSLDGTSAHLTVEKMAGKDTRWEWSAWCSAELDGWSCHGYSDSGIDAMRSAERANSSRVRECASRHKAAQKLGAKHCPDAIFTEGRTDALDATRNTSSATSTAPGEDAEQLPHHHLTPSRSRFRQGC